MSVPRLKGKIYSGQLKKMIKMWQLGQMYLL